MDVRVTTFNLENLFNRYALLDEPWANRSYEKMVQSIGLVSIASRAGDLVAYNTTDIQRNNTAQAILDSKPDILAVQEVENLYTLRIFNDQYLDDYFDRILLIDGNDPRGIDVGFLVRTGFKVEVTSVRTHVADTVAGKSRVDWGTRPGWGYLAGGALFSRDCLEIDVRVGTTTLTFMVNHFKAQDKTKASVDRRRTQATRVAELVKARAKEGKLPVVLGDLNVPPGKDDSLDALLKSPVLKDTLPKNEWTHYYVPSKTTSRLDYILTHKSLAAGSPEIVRSGLTTKCKQYTGPRYPTVGAEHTEASDHCPVTVSIAV